MVSLPKLCLNMIVKDEAHIIEERLTSLLSKINFDYYVICDTGSSDNTKEIMKNTFDKFHIQGEFYDHTWSDFGTNRTLALQAAYGKSEYLLIFDADDEIVGMIHSVNSYFPVVSVSPPTKELREFIINSVKMGEEKRKGIKKKRTSEPFLEGLGISPMSTPSDLNF